MYAVHPKLAKEFADKTINMKKLPEKKEPTKKKEDSKSKENKRAVPKIA